jgi:xanthine/uracil permease
VSVFREINGLPGHILIVHAVVALVPLLALVSVAYGVLPRWRSRLDWALVALAVVTPVAAWLSTESGEAFEEVLRGKNYPAQILDQVREHSEYGEILRSVTFGLAAAALLLLLVTSNHPRVRGLPRWLAPVLTGVVVVLAVFALVYVYLTGDSGAQAVWGGTL